MKITLETIEAAVALIIFLALAVERGVEFFRPVILKIKDINWQNSAKIAVAIVLGTLTAALLRLDFLTTVGIPMFGAWAGYAAAGVLASAGASPWHALLEWLKTLKNDTKTITTTYTNSDNQKTSSKEVTEATSVAPVTL